MNTVKRTTRDTDGAGNPRVLYNIEEACEMLSMSRSKFYDLISQGKIRVVKLGTGLNSGVRFRLADLTAFADSNVR